MKKKAKLENWYIGFTGEFYGQVYGHPAFEDGSFIGTSKTVRHENGELETLNTIYTLGKVREGFGRDGSSN